MPDKQWLTIDDVVREFGISKSTQAKLRMKRKIPFSKVGRMVRYRRDKLDNWLNAAEVSRGGAA